MELNSFFYANISKDSFNIQHFNKYLEENGRFIQQNSLPDTIWTYENPEFSRIKQKVESQGIPIEDWDIKINYGIKTGLNKAFVVDGNKKNELIKQDIKNEIFFKPLLRGRDIQKFSPDYKNLWLLYIPKGFTIKSILYSDVNAISEPIPRYGYVEQNEAWNWFEKQFPFVANHLYEFKNIAEKRTDMGDYWWEQRSCAYIDSFNSPKIIYPNMTKFLPFIYDDRKYYTNQKCFILTGQRLEFLTAFFNSNLFKFCFRENFPELLGGTRELSKVFFEKIPVKQITEDQELPFKERVTQILAHKKEGKDISHLEKQIDQMIYKLYELTEEEIKIVEEAVK